MEIIVQGDKIVGTAKDGYQGLDETIHVPDNDIRVAKYEWLKIVEGEVVYDALTELAQIRYEKETSGITLVDGVSIATDRQTQSILNAAYNRAKIDPTFCVDWKGENGWVTLTADMVINIGDKVFSYVQACFSHERELSELLDHDSSTDITVGWPTREGL